MFGRTYAEILTILKFLLEKSQKMTVINFLISVTVSSLPYTVISTYYGWGLILSSHFFCLIDSDQRSLQLQVQVLYSGPAWQQPVLES